MKAGRVSRSLAALLSAAALSTGAAAAPGDTQMVFWTAGDCGPCKLWSHTERRLEFLTEAKRLGVDLVVVSRPRVADPVERYVWPATQQELKARMAELPAAQLTPSFDFICKGQLQRRLAGVDDWDSFWRKSLRQLARDCA